jgi:glyoxylase-like metal-dependent hydrolase (beta-lactamase superfamily II)
MRGGDPEAMYRSLSQVLLKVPDSTRLFPGHDYADVPVAPMRTSAQESLLHLPGHGLLRGLPDAAPALRPHFHSQRVACGPETG